MPVFGQSREERIKGLVEAAPIPEAKKPELASAAHNHLNVLNAEQKKKPHNINIKNYNRNEPKVYKNIKYSNKQSYRRFKTKIEPKLHDKIMVDEEDDLISKLKKAFGIEEPAQKTNYSDVITAPSQAYGGIDEPKEVPAHFYTSDGNRRKNYGDDDYDFNFFDSDLISDVSNGDRETLTYQFQPRNQTRISLPQRQEQPKRMERHSDGIELDVYHTMNNIIGQIEDKHERAGSVITRSMTRFHQNKNNRTLQRDLATAKQLNSEDDIEGITVSPMRRGNRVVALDIQTNSPIKQMKLRGNVETPAKGTGEITSVSPVSSTSTPPRSAEKQRPARFKTDEDWKSFNKRQAEYMAHKRSNERSGAKV